MARSPSAAAGAGAGLASISGCRAGAGHQYQHQQLAQAWPQECGAVLAPTAGAGAVLSLASKCSSWRRGWPRPPGAAASAGAEHGLDHRAQAQGLATATRRSNWHRHRAWPRSTRAGDGTGHQHQHQHQHQQLARAWPQSPSAAAGTGAGLASINACRGWHRPPAPAPAPAAGAGLATVTRCSSWRPALTVPGAHCRRVDLRTVSGGACMVVVLQRAWLALLRRRCWWRQVSRIQAL